MDELITWLRAQLDVDQKAAEEMKKVFPTPWELADRGWMVRIVADKPHFREVVRLEQQHAPDGYGWLSDAVEHVFLQDPDRVLREVETKRRLIAMYQASARAAADDPNDDEQVHCARGLGYAVQLAALPFSDRPGYRNEWKP